MKRRISLKGPWMMSLGVHLAALLALVLILESLSTEERNPSRKQPLSETTRVSITALSPSKPSRKVTKEEKKTKETPRPSERGNKKDQKKSGTKGESSESGKREPKGPPSNLKGANRARTQKVSVNGKKKAGQEAELKARGRFTQIEKSREELEAFRRREMVKVARGDRNGIPGLKVSYVNLLDQTLSYKGLAYQLVCVDREEREEVMLVDPEGGDYRRVPFFRLDRTLYSNRVFNPLEGHDHFKKILSEIAARERVPPDRLELLFLIPKESLALLDWKVISAIKRSGYEVKDVGSATGHYQHLSNGSVVLVIDSFTLKGSAEEIKVTAADPELQFLRSGDEQGNS